jgi:DNA-binding transcriptional LysR family regulator
MKKARHHASEDWLLNTFSRSGALQHGAELLHTHPPAAEAGMDRFDQIATFVRVVELGGFSAAARDLGMAASVVTTHIQALEQRLGARLLNRNTRSVKVTEVGEAYYRRCVDLLNRLEQADGFVESMQTAPRGTLRVNTSLALADLITPVITQYTAQFPDISVRLIATGRQVDFIEQQFDVSIRHGMPTNGSLIVRKLAEYDFVVCASPKYFADRRRPQTPEDLADHNCVLYTDSEYGNRWPIFDSPKDVKVSGNLQTNSPIVLLRAAENGHGIVVLPRFAAASALAEGRLIELLVEQTTLRKPICAIHPHRGLVPTKTTVFIDMVAEHLRRVLAPGKSQSRRRSPGRPGFEASPPARLRKIGAAAPARVN